MPPPFAAALASVAAGPPMITGLLLPIVKRGLGASVIVDSSAVAAARVSLSALFPFKLMPLRVTDPA